VRGEIYGSSKAYEGQRSPLVKKISHGRDAHERKKRKRKRVGLIRTDEGRACDNRQGVEGIFCNCIIRANTPNRLARRIQPGRARRARCKYMTNSDKDALTVRGM
jgi:hypothetical protein